MNLNARELGYKELNEKIRNSKEDISISSCFGERFIGAGAESNTITVNGTPGNALGAYLDGASIIINGNVQDAVGDTMNDGKIIVNGNAGDALGYAMRGGKIFVKGNAGYRAGIHMKQYQDKRPVIIVGGNVGSFLGEYLAGGLIIVLGLGAETFPAGNFVGTGMHGGEIYLRTDSEIVNLSNEVAANKATADEMNGIMELLNEFSDVFGISIDEVLGKAFYRLTPNTQNPYRQLYTEN